MTISVTVRKGTAILFQGSFDALSKWLNRTTFFSVCSGIEAASLAWKPLGNSWAVPKFTWIGDRIQRFMPCD